MAERSSGDSSGTDLKDLLDSNIMVNNSSNSLDRSSSDPFDDHLARCRDVDSGWIDTVFNAIIDGRIPVDRSKFTSYVPPSSP